VVDVGDDAKIPDIFHECMFGAKDSGDGDNTSS